MHPDSPEKNNSLFPDQDFETEEDSTWQISYLDIFTILLGFMFVLLSLTELNQIEFTSVSPLFESSSQESEFITTPIDEIKKELEVLLQKEIERGQLHIVRDLNDIRIRFSSDDLYRSGSATLQLSALDLLDRALEAIQTVPYDDYHIDVEGHTDSTPISSQIYPSNWELSTARASKIVKYFTHMGISKKRLKASGYADSQPRAPNQDSLGNPIPENKDLNRRIVLRLYYTAADTQQTDTDLASIESVQQPDTSSTCQYSVQAGSFASFPEAFNFLQRTEERTSHDFDITYNGSQFSVRTKPKPAYSQVLDAYQRISSQVDQSTAGLIHQCYDSRQASPVPLSFQIQFGAFQSQKNALAYMAGLSEEHQISTHLADDSSDLFKVVSRPYEETETAIAKLNIIAEQQLSNGPFIDYISSTPRRHYFEGQLQLGQFSSETKARTYAEQIENEMDTPIRVTQFDAPTYSVVSRTFKSWRKAFRLKESVDSQMPNRSPVLHLLEFSRQLSSTWNSSR